MSVKKIRALLSNYGVFILCASALMILTAWILGVNGLGAIDDHHIMSTLLQGKDLGFSNSINLKIARFFPLTGQEYSLLSKIFSPSPTLFYTVNALKLLLCGFLLYQCLIATGLNGAGVLVLWSTVIFSIGVANASVRLLVGELNLLILTLVFIWASQIVLKKEPHQRGVHNRGVAVIGALSLFLALFYKELAFVFGVVFGLSEFLRYYRIYKTKPPKFVFAAFLMGAAYISGYYIWCYFYVTGSYIKSHVASFPNIFTSFVHNDPFFIFVVLPLVVYRIFVILRVPTKHTCQDSFLIASSAYMISFLVIRIFNSYYLLPAYAFAVCGVAGVLSRMDNKLIRNSILFVTLLCGIYVLPIAFSDIDSEKAKINNHYQFVKYMAHWLNNEKIFNRSPRNLVLSGVSPANGIEIVSSLKIFLSSLGTPESLFHVQATEPVDNLQISLENSIKDIGRYSPKIKDIVIFNPYQQAFSPAPLQSPSFKEIYRSPQEWTLPRWSGWDWVKFCVLDYRNCMLNFREDRRYAGYAAFEVVRQIEMPSLDILKSPQYRIGPLKIPSHLPTLFSQIVEVLIENTGSESWPAIGRFKDGVYVNLGYRWFNESGQEVLQGARSLFPESIKPGDKVRLNLIFKTPPKPGKYKLVIEPVQEGIGWFKVNNGQMVDVY